MKRLLLVLISFCICLPAYATTFYVSKAGSDAHACSSTDSAGTNKLTIQGGIGCLATAGDTLDIHSGTYIETIDSYSYTIPSGTSFSSAMTIQGHAGETVTIKPNAGMGTGFVLHLAHSNHHIIFDNLVFDATNVPYDCINISYSGTTESVTTAHHIRIKNSEVRYAGFGQADPGHSVSQGIFTGGYANYCEFINLNVHHNGAAHFFDHGLYLESDHMLVDGCDIHDNKAWGLQFQAEVGHYHMTGNIARNNKIHANASGIVLNRLVDGALLYNNLIYGNTGIPANYEGDGIDLVGATLNTGIYSNTIYGNPGSGVQDGDTSNNTTGNIIRNNILYSNTAGTITGAGANRTTSNNVTSNPGFTSAGTGDFTLTAGSAAIGQGFDLSATFTTDYAGTTRTVPWDVGAYKYASATPSISISSPTAGANWQIGTGPQTISWTSVANSGFVDITGDLDGNGSLESAIATNLADTGSYQWATVTGTPTSSAKIDVKDHSAATHSTSGLFTLTAATVTPSITIVSPVGGQTYPKGSTIILSWTTTNLTGNVKIELSRNNGSVWTTLFASTPYNSTDLTFTATIPSSSLCRIRISSLNQPSVTVLSSAFRLGGSIM